MSFTPTRISISSNVLTDRSNRDSISSAQNWDNFTVEPAYINPSIAKAHILKSRPTSKPSITISAESMSCVNKTVDNIRNSFTAASSCPAREEQENKAVRVAKETNDALFHSVSINNSVKFTQNPPVDRFAEERRKSESIYLRSTINTVPSFIKRPSELKEAPIRDEISQMIDQLSSRMAATEEQVLRLKQRERKSLTLQGEFKQFRGKLLDLAKFNSKHFTEYECKLDQQEKMMEDVRERLMSLSGSQHYKKINLLQVKLHELYEGFRIKEDHNEKAIEIGINNVQNTIRDYLNAELTNIKQQIHEKQANHASIIAKISKLQADLKEKLPFSMQEFHKGSKKSSTFRTVQTKQLMVLRQNELSKQRSKSKFCNSPRQWVYQTPTKENIDTPIKELAFQEPNKEIIVRQQTYFIDSEGYLLDEDKHYLLDSKNQQILLPASLIACLRQHDMLS